MTNNDKSEEEGEATISMSMDQAATWPSEQEMKGSSWYYWDVAQVKRIWNQSGLYFSFQELRDHVQSTFDDVLCPFFNSDDAANYIDTTLPSNNSVESNDKALWNTFIYALSLSWSRSHEEEHGHPGMIPLVELFNGHSDRINQVAVKRTKGKTVINVDLALGSWPFIGGGRFINTCNLPCSSVYAMRDIDEGEELVLSYGNVSPTEFVAKYGSLPHDFLNHFNILSDVSLWIPPQFIPTETMRVKALERSGFPLTILKQSKGDTALLHLHHGRDDIEMYRGGNNEPEMIKRMRQYLILAVLADDFELERNYNTGRLRGPVYESRVLPLMCQVVDYNIEQLSGDSSTTTSAEDAERAAGPIPAWEKNCLLARVAYRESLLMWRHVFAKRGEDAMNFEEYSNVDDDDVNTDGRCRVCGRSYPAKKCAKCKEVRYCSRGHQQLDWKGHKSVCGK